MSKVIVFDLGGTLMEFKCMPQNWTDYYIRAFNQVNNKLNLNLSADDISKSAEVLKSFNPRNNYREKEIAPSTIYDEATKHWNNETDINIIIKIFFEGLKLQPIIYNYTFKLIDDYKSKGYKIACLTDLPNGMPDEIFKEHIKDITNRLDLYVSSQTCGFRKPNKFGIEYIANYFSTSVSSIIFIGDEVKDKLTAQKAGCEFKFIEEIINEYN